MGEEDCMVEILFRIGLLFLFDVWRLSIIWDFSGIHDSTHYAGAGRKLAWRALGLVLRKGLSPLASDEEEAPLSRRKLEREADPHWGTSRERLKSSRPSKLPVPLLSFPIIIYLSFLHLFAINTRVIKTLDCSFKLDYLWAFQAWDNCTDWFWTNIGKHIIHIIHIQLKT